MDINQRSPIRDWGPNSSVDSVGTISQGVTGRNSSDDRVKFLRTTDFFSEEATDSMRQIWEYDGIWESVNGNIWKYIGHFYWNMLNYGNWVNFNRNGKSIGDSWNIYGNHIWEYLGKFHHLTVLHWEWWLVGVTIPKWPYFRLVKYYNLPKNGILMDMYGKDIGDMEHLFFGKYLGNMCICGKMEHVWINTLVFHVSYMWVMGQNQAVPGWYLKS